MASNQMAVRRMLLMYALAMSFGGMPLLYMGDELAQTNDSSYLDDIDRSHDGRWLQRPMFDEVAMNQVHHADQASLAYIVYSGLQRLLEKRRQLPAFSAQVPSRLIRLPRSSVLAFVRGELEGGANSEHKPVLCLFNFSELEVVLDQAQLREAMKTSLGLGADLVLQKGCSSCGVDGDVQFNAGNDDRIVLAAYAALWIS